MPVEKSEDIWSYLDIVAPRHESLRLETSKSLRIIPRAVHKHSLAYDWGHGQADCFPSAKASLSSPSSKVHSKRAGMVPSSS